LTEKGLVRLDPIAPFRARLAALDARIKLAAPQSHLGRAATRLATLRQRLGPLGQRAVESREGKLKECERRGNSAANKTLGRLGHALALLRARLDGLNPAAPLERGFVLVSDHEGRHVKSSLEVQANAKLRLRWGDGERNAVAASM
jgi:exodeoxyribonuclease VII large subunit